MSFSAVRKGLVVAALAVLLVLASGCTSSRASSGAEPLRISVWTYYNGDQLAAFQDLVARFNETVGAQEGIAVEGYNLGSVSDLQDAVLDSVEGKVGAQPVPNMFAAYADTAYAIDQKGMLADLAPYLDQEERDLFVDGYLEEGTLGDADSIKIFPVAKSVELQVLNETDFEPFAAEAGVSYDDLATFEGVAEVAEKFYEWTDAQTPEPNDGKAFFGIDSMANYFFIGAKQLGVDIVSVENGQAHLSFDKDMVRRLWDGFYVPFVKGHYDASGRYRSDDVKTGNIICLLGSSSGATYFPMQVTNQEGESHNIQMKVLACPQFAGGQPWAVQQGAGMVVIDKSPEEVEACVKFLEWFASPEQNLQFSIASGYLPVMKSANDMNQVEAVEGELDDRMKQVLETAFATVSGNSLYTPQAFENGAAFRSELENSLFDLAVADAQAVQAAVAEGTTREKALEPYLEDAYFEEWYKGIYKKLDALVNTD